MPTTSTHDQIALSESKVIITLSQAKCRNLLLPLTCEKVNDYFRKKQLQIVNVAMAYCSRQDNISLLAPTKDDNFRKSRKR